MSDTTLPAPTENASADDEALERAIAELLGGDPVTTVCPRCEEVLAAAHVRDQVLVACPNACIGTERRLRADPDWSMRMLWVLAAAVVLGLALIRVWYFGSSTVIEQITP